MQNIVVRNNLHGDVTTQPTNQCINLSRSRAVVVPLYFHTKFFRDHLPRQTFQLALRTNRAHQGAAGSGSLSSQSFE